MEARPAGASEETEARDCAFGSGSPGLSAPPCPPGPFRDLRPEATLHGRGMVTEIS